MTIAVYSAQLENVVGDLDSAKQARDDAQQKYEAAAKEYDDILIRINELRNSINSELDKLMPTNRVR